MWSRIIFMNENQRLYKDQGVFGYMIFIIIILHNPCCGIFMFSVINSQYTSTSAEIFRVVFQWNGQLMRLCCMVNIPPKVTCKYKLPFPSAINSLNSFPKEILSIKYRLGKKNSWLCHIILMSSIIYLIYVCSPLRRWSYGVVLYEIFTIGNFLWNLLTLWWWFNYELFC